MEAYYKCPKFACGYPECDRLMKIRERTLADEYGNTTYSAMCTKTGDVVFAIRASELITNPNSVAIPDEKDGEHVTNTQQSQVDIHNLATKDDVANAVKSINANTDRQFRSYKLWLARFLDETVRLVKYLFGVFQKKIKPTADNIDAAANYRYAHLEKLSEQHREQVCAIIDYSHNVQPITYDRSKAKKYKAGKSFWDVANIVIADHPKWKGDTRYYDATHLADVCQKMAGRPIANSVNFRFANPQT